MTQQLYGGGEDHETAQNPLLLLDAAELINAALR